MTKEHVAYWSDEQRRRDAIERFWEGFPYREVPDGGPCLWVSRAGIDGAGLNPLDALRRSCAADIDAWERSALQGERHPHEDLLQAREHRPELALARLKVELACHALEQAKEEEKTQARAQVEREQAALRDAEEVMVFDLLRSGFQQRQAWLSLQTLTAREQAATRRLASTRPCRRCGGSRRAA